MAYEFQEYPKRVTGPDGKRVTVRNEAEEETILGGDPVMREEDERKRLLAVAEVKGVKVDKRWGLDRIEKAIADAGHDPALNPFA